MWAITKEATMATLQTAFISFHDNIKLDDENETLVEKREILLKKLKKKISNDAASYTSFNQGSYAMHTGIKPDDGDFDIDVGLEFNINKDDYSDPVKVKKWVKDALDGHTKSVTIRRSCVTVQYQENDEPIYHVDFAIFASNNADGKLYIAKGKENSDSSNKVWEVSDPKGLMSCIRDKFTESKDRAQFRRAIRYLKKWKSKKFTSSGNSAPTGIALTILAYDLFHVSKTYDYVSTGYKYDDFTALVNLVDSIKSAFTLTYDFDSDSDLYTISTFLPVEPYNDLFSKMTTKQQDAFYNKIVDLSSKLDEVESKSLLSEKCVVLQSIFGDDDFPIKSARSIIGSHESA